MDVWVWCVDCGDVATDQTNYDVDLCERCWNNAMQYDEDERAGDE